MENHLFVWHNEVKLQVDGLGIGADLTRAVARLVMLDWDQKLLQLAEHNKLTVYMYNRYVDDTANGMEALAPGVRWGEEEKAMVFLPHMVDEDKEVAADERTMREVLRMGSSINPCIQLTGDCPSINESRAERCRP